MTDKGVPAAMVMAAARSVLRATASRVVEPGAVLERVNDLLCPDIPEKMFVTCLYGVVDPESGRFRFANAGHNLPFARTPDGAVELRATGMPLGLHAGHELRGEGGVDRARRVAAPLLGRRHRGALGRARDVRHAAAARRSSPAATS